MITVDEIMTTDLVTLPDSATVQDAVQLMEEKHIRHIPVVDAAGALIGLVSHRDVLASTDSTLRTQDQRQNPASVPLSKIMTRNVSTVEETTNLRNAALHIQKHKYGCLLVVTQGKLRGIITNSDFVAVAINLLQQLDETEPPDLDF
ncbi:MAG: CBS domain-containing protein [Gammaproteobacteria bacterium]|nr:MAG: CBS domain-containing protein [Gammaproteobacteria bacterium]